MMHLCSALLWFTDIHHACDSASVRWPTDANAAPSNASSGSFELTLPRSEDSNWPALERLKAPLYCVW